MGFCSDVLMMRIKLALEECGDSMASGGCTLTLAGGRWGSQCPALLLEGGPWRGWQMPLGEKVCAEQEDAVTELKPSLVSVSFLA